jgi:hypothetical protein
MIQDPQNERSLGVALESAGTRLSRAEFRGLDEMPLELEWFARPRQPAHPAEPTASGVRDFTWLKMPNAPKR